MADMPKQPYVNLGKAMRNLMGATVAVREGIATHAEKHTAELHAKHAKMEAERRLNAKTALTGGKTT